MYYYNAHPSSQATNSSPIIPPISLFSPDFVGVEQRLNPPPFGPRFIGSSMPGILPMKVIKVGSNSQSRIAQACDRCRSKKIRCDGVRPTCSQCLAVGFECRTSDKLSRRAFPRGYTETLEERVRTLEAEVRELKELLDQKDENIDMLTKLRSNSAQSAPPALPSSARAHGPLPQSGSDAPAPAAAAAEVLHVQDTARADVGDPNRAGFAGICANHILLRKLTLLPCDELPSSTPS